MERCCIKIQKQWRLRVATRKLKEQRHFVMEATPEREAAARIIERAVRYHINKKRRRWRPATLTMGTERRAELNGKIRDYAHRPFKEITWENNAQWLQEQSMAKFHEYRLSRSDQALASAERLGLRRSLDRTLVKLEAMSSLRDLDASMFTTST
jgi:hypothetical protein